MFLACCMLGNNSETLETQEALIDAVRGLLFLKQPCWKTHVHVLMTHVHVTIPRFTRLKDRPQQSPRLNPIESLRDVLE